MVPLFTFIPEFVPRFNCYVQTSSTARFGSIQDLCMPTGTRPRPPEIDRQRLSVVGMVSQEDDFDILKVVFRAVPGLPNYVVAMKSLHVSADPVYRSFLMQEAALLVDLDHPHVVKLIGIVTLADPIGLVLEYCEYGLLEQYILRNDLSLSEEYRIAGDVADGMAYLHSQHIVHRSLAAGNIMIDSTKRCKISLTGHSRCMFGDSAAVYQGDAVPVHWCAPECLTQQLFSEQSDVWAFGVVLYEVFTRGGIPFEDMLGKQVREVLISGTKPPMPHGCPAELATILRMCWSEYGARASFVALAKHIRVVEASSSIEKEQGDIRQMRIDDV